MSDQQTPVSSENQAPAAEGKGKGKSVEAQAMEQDDESSSEESGAEAEVWPIPKRTEYRCSTLYTSSTSLSWDYLLSKKQRC